VNDWQRYVQSVKDVIRGTESKLLQSVGARQDQKLMAQSKDFKPAKLREFAGTLPRELL
jgi:hypothetical protein